MGIQKLHFGNGSDNFSVSSSTDDLIQEFNLNRIEFVERLCDLSPARRLIYLDSDESHETHWMHETPLWTDQWPILIAVALTILFLILAALAYFMCCGPKHQTVRVGSLLLVRIVD